MSGTVIVAGDASQSAGASGRGGLLVIGGSASARCGISMKGVEIVVHGSVGHVRVHGAAGGLVVCGDAGEGPRRLDLRDARLRPRRGREPRSRLRREGDARRAPCGARRRCSSRRGRLRRGEFRRYGSARRLYNFNVDHAGDVLMAGWRPGPARIRAVRPQHDPRDPAMAREGIYDIRGFGAKRRVPHFDDLSSSAPASRATRSRATASGARPTSPSGPGSRSSRSTSTSRSRSPG